MLETQSVINTLNIIYAKLGAILDIRYQQDSLYIATDVDHTYHHSTGCEQYIKSIQNINIKAIDLKNFNIRHSY